MKKFQRLLCRFLNKEVLEVLLSMCILVPFMVYYFVLDKKNLLMFIDFTIFTTILAVFLSKVVAGGLAGYLLNRIEDSIKLELDHNKLVKMYPRTSMVSYQNTDAAMKAAGKAGQLEKQVFPVTQLPFCVGSKLEIADCRTEYQLPDQIASNRQELMHAHSSSVVYNQLNIRLDDIEARDGTVVLHTSRTSFFSSLITNRAMDYDFEKGCTIRDLYCYGPFLPSLSESKLSNHLGVNGFVQTADGKLVFVQRSVNVSIGKNSLGTSVGASIKAKYALDEELNFTQEGLRNSIVKEIQDELCIEEEFIDFSLKQNIIAIYRDIVEGGKPQLLFYLKVGLSFAEIENRFYKTSQDKKDGKLAEVKMSKDGSSIIGIDVSQLDQLYIQPDMLIYQKKQYTLMPSASASIVMLIKYLDTGNDML